MATALDQLTGSDPYAAIRTFSPNAFRFRPATPGGAVDAGSGSAWMDPTAAGWDVTSDEVSSAQAAGGFGSKFSNVRDLGDGRLQVTMQAPGGHKYDTIEVVYGQGPDGQWTMQGAPTASRQVSSGERWRDTAEPFLALGGALGAAYLGGSALGGGGGGAGGIGAADAAGALGGAEMAGGTAGASGIAPVAETAVSIPALASPVSGSVGSSAAGAGGGMSWFDWANLAANVGSSAIQDRAANRATDAQVGAANAATGLQRDMFNTVQEQQAPYRGAGYAALNDLMGARNYDPTPNAAAVMAEPGYQFGMDEGMRGIGNSAAARGMGLSGSTLRALSRFNSDYATTRYGDAWNRAQAGFSNRWGRLSALAGIGQTANQLTNQAQQGYANNAGQNMMGAANAIGAGAMTRGNIWGNALNQGVSQWGRTQQRPANQGYGYSGQPGWSSDPNSDPYYMGP